MLNRATREFLRCVHELRRRDDSAGLMRDELRRYSNVPLIAMLAAKPANLVEFFPELVMQLCTGRVEGIEAARDLIRLLPKAEVEGLLVADLQALVDGFDADEISQLADIVIELGLTEGLACIRLHLGAIGGSESDELLRDLEAVENDPMRWRRARSEWG